MKHSELVKAAFLGSLLSAGARFVGSKAIPWITNTAMPKLLNTAVGFGKGKILTNGFKILPNGLGGAPAAIGGKLMQGGVGGFARNAFMGAGTMLGFNAMMPSGQEQTAQTAQAGPQTLQIPQMPMPQPAVNPAAKQQQAAAQTYAPMQQALEHTSRRTM